MHELDCPLLRSFILWTCARISVPTLERRPRQTVQNAPTTGSSVRANLSVSMPASLTDYLCYGAVDLIDGLSAEQVKDALAVSCTEMEAQRHAALAALLPGKRLALPGLAMLHAFQATHGKGCALSKLQPGPLPNKVREDVMLQLYRKISGDKITDDATLLDQAIKIYRRRVSGTRPPDGTLWRNVGPSRPEIGVEIRNAALSAALQWKVTFSSQELQALCVKRLHHNSFIKAGEDYYEALEKPSLGMRNWFASLSFQKREPLSGSGGAERLQIEVAENGLTVLRKCPDMDVDGLKVGMECWVMDPAQFPLLEVPRAMSKEDKRWYRGQITAINYRCMVTPSSLVLDTPPPISIRILATADGATDAALLPGQRDFVCRKKHLRPLREGDLVASSTPRRSAVVGPSSARRLAVHV